MANRRKSKSELWARQAIARLWEMRFVLLLACLYLLLAGWLFSGSGSMGVRPADVYTVSDEPEWKAPDADHWFGTTGTGLDLFELSRVGMATSLAVSAVAAAAGIGLAHLLVSLFMFDPSEKRFRLLLSGCRTLGGLPAMAVVILLVGGAGGNQGVLIFTLAAVVGIHLAPVIANWFQEGEEGFDVLAAYALGLSRLELVRGRVLRKVLRRYPGLFAALIPVLMLVEMTVSFLGFGGDRITCGSLIAYGQELIIEAPWMAIYPGILASAVVLVFSLLGWLVKRSVKAEQLERFL